MAETGQDDAAAAADFAVAHRELLADSAIQFSLMPYRPPEVPAWLRWLGEFLQAIWPALKILFWGAAAVAVLFILYVVARRILDGGWPWERKATRPADKASWQPEEGTARALLDEADALAANGRYSEAAHVLLARSIEEIDSRRPQLVRPALTGRDIAAAAAIPAAPRGAFAAIVARVETSLFGGRALGESDWRDCRTAYERFAFAEEWRDG